MIHATLEYNAPKSAIPFLVEIVQLVLQAMGKIARVMNFPERENYIMIY